MMKATPLNPFDLKVAIFAKHAQHVVLIHFPIALFIVGVAFDSIGRMSGKAALVSAAYYNLLVAALSAIPAVATGLLAWRFQLDGQRLHGILLLHLVLGSTSAILIWIVWWLQFRAKCTARIPNIWPFAGRIRRDGGLANRPFGRISNRSQRTG